MKLKLTLGIIGCTLLSLLIPSIIHAQNADYGTNRQRRTCPSRSEPKSGSISAKQATIYAACSYEEQKVFNTAVDFVDILSLQVSPKSRRATFSEHELNQIDIEKPVYDIRGSIVVYSCHNTLSGTYPRGRNCTVYTQPKSHGKCYQTVFSDWYCALGIGYASPDLIKHDMPAPQAPK